MQHTPFKQAMAVLTLSLAAGSVWAQGAVISAPGVDVRGGSQVASVTVNGAVVDAGSGCGVCNGFSRSSPGRWHRRGLVHRTRPLIGSWRPAVI